MDLPARIILEGFWSSWSTTGALGVGAVAILALIILGRRAPIWAGVVAVGLPVLVSCVYVVSVHIEVLHLLTGPPPGPEPRSVAERWSLGFHPVASAHALAAVGACGLAVSAAWPHRPRHGRMRDTQWFTLPAAFLAACATLGAVLLPFTPFVAILPVVGAALAVFVLLHVHDGPDRLRGATFFTIATAFAATTDLVTQQALHTLPWHFDIVGSWGTHGGPRYPMWGDHLPGLLLDVASLWPRLHLVGLGVSWSGLLLLILWSGPRSCRPRRTDLRIPLFILLLLALALVPALLERPRMGGRASAADRSLPITVVEARPDSLLPSEGVP